MNISWDDFGKIEEAGDHPFRDGTITVSYTEIEIWKKHPSARFQLMHKHPVRALTAYVLGKQIGEETLSARPFFESSNGDAWSLTEDAETGARTVMHRPNLESGGKISYVTIDRFLAEHASGPEHLALRRLLETSTSLVTILIAYDIHPLKGDAYDRLTEAVKSLGAWWHHLETVWIVRCQGTPEEIGARLKSHIGIEDQLIVVDISGDAASWIGINELGSAWLADNV